MQYEDRIRRARPEMSKSFAKLADFLLDSYVEAAFMTASELAHALNLDAATVVRFSQFLGYSGFPELQHEIRERVKGDLLIRPRQAEVDDSTPSLVVQAMEELSHALDQTRIILDTDSLEKLVERMGQVRRIVVIPEGPAQPSAYSLVHYLEQGGFPVYIARAGVADLARTINTATPQDLLIAVEVVGQSPYIARAIEEAHTKGIPTAAIVGASSLASARSADVVLAAQAHPSLGVGIICIEAIVYCPGAGAALCALLTTSPEQSSPSLALSARIQQPFD